MQTPGVVQVAVGGPGVYVTFNPPLLAFYNRDAVVDDLYACQSVRLSAARTW